MRSFKRVFGQQTQRLAVAVALLATAVLPALVPAIVSAATVTTRSVELSNSSKAATGVSYKVKFTTPTDTTTTGAFVVDFCDTAAVNTACNTPTGFDAQTNLGTSGSHTVTAVDSGTVRVVLGASVGPSAAVEAELTGIVNPSASDTLYARIVTYVDSTAAGAYVAADNLGTTQDDGSVALAITDNIGVTGAVLETLLFCASSEEIGADCLDTGGQPLALPNVSLGTNGVLNTDLSEATIYSQISTNADGGAVVNLKSNAEGCGGLIRSGAPTACDIAPVSGTAAAITPGEAKFGLKLGEPTATTGAISAVAGYNTTTYFMNYVANELSGVTSTYGDPIYNTGGDPVSGGEVDLTFGASTSNVTPAGNYSATLNLIATGTF